MNLDGLRTVLTAELNQGCSFVWPAAKTAEREIYRFYWWVSHTLYFCFFVYWSKMILKDFRSFQSRSIELEKLPKLLGFERLSSINTRRVFAAAQTTGGGLYLDTKTTGCALLRLFW